MCSEVFCIGFYVPCSKAIPRQRIPIFLRVLFNDTNVYITIYWLTINKKAGTGKRGGNGFHILGYLFWNRSWTCHKKDYVMNEYYIMSAIV